MRKMKYIKAPFHKKAAILRGKVTPMSFYQCETCPVNASVLEGLRTAYVDVLTVASSRRSVDLTFNVASYGEDVDPDLEIVHRRAATFRRNRNKQNATAKLLQENSEICVSNRVPGTFFRT